jgi:site-specific recombinase XerD
MASLTTADIRAYVAQRQADGYANATINRELAALKRMFTLECVTKPQKIAPYCSHRPERGEHRRPTSSGTHGAWAE